MLNTHLAQQLSGPVAQSVINAAESAFNTTLLELAYMLDMDIETVEDDLLYQLGLWAGMPWPLAPDGTFEGDGFYLSDAANYPETGAGFDVGLLLDSSVSGLTRYPRAVYLAVLKAYCKIKASGFSLRLIEEAVTAFWPTYTIAYDANKDLVFTFLPNVSGAYLFVLRALVAQLSYAPAIIFEQG